MFLDVFCFSGFYSRDPVDYHNASDSYFTQDIPHYASKVDYRLHTILYIYAHLLFNIVLATEMN